MKVLKAFKAMSVTGEDCSSPSRGDGSSEGSIAVEVVMVLELVLGMAGVHRWLTRAESVHLRW
jgi:hypothetical protein